MTGTDAGKRQYRSIIVILAAMWIGSAIIIASCGSDGGSDGQLCQACGDSDGPCRSTGTVEAGHPDASEVCVNGTGPCTVGLVCRRKLDSAQRRCFPVLEGTSDPDPEPAAFFHCDGSRPNAEVRLCGNNTKESNEVCDGTDLDDMDCTDVCPNEDADGDLSCANDCSAFDTTGCTDCELPEATPTPTSTPTATRTPIL